VTLAEDNLRWVGMVFAADLQLQGMQKHHQDAVHQQQRYPLLLHRKPPRHTLAFSCDLLQGPVEMLQPQVVRHCSFRLPAHRDMGPVIGILVLPDTDYSRPEELTSFKLCAVVR
jgi:hypothetical protein